VLAGVRGGHAGVELAALTAALIIMGRYATLQDCINTPDQEQDQDQNRSGVEPLLANACSFGFELTGVLLLMIDNCNRLLNTLYQYSLNFHFKFGICNSCG